MQKLVLLLAFNILLAYSYYQGDCPCGSSHAFNQQTYTCDKYPSPNKQGYVEGCQEYIINAFNNFQWKCNKCKPSYNSERGQCISNGIPGCTYAQKIQNNSNQLTFLSSDDVQYKCQVCSDGYYTDNETCVKYPKKGEKGYIQGCTSYNSQDQCFQCEQGYYIDLTQYICKKVQVNIPNCILYGDRKNCLNCKQGLVLKDQKECLKPEQVIQNCQIAYNYFLKINCIQCYPGYYIDQNKCVANPTTKQEGKIDNCQIYKVSTSGQIVCDICNDSYALTYNQLGCQALNIQPIKDCNQYQINEFGTQVCLYCKNGSNPQHQEVNFQCKKCPINPDQQQNIENSY